MRRHAFRIGDVVALLNAPLRPVALIGADGRTDDTTRSRADAGAATATDGGAKTCAESRADERRADRLVVGFFGLTRRALVGVVLTGCFVLLERGRRFVLPGLA